eukprot:3940587-Rhodomonas_salina.1
MRMRHVTMVVVEMVALVGKRPAASFVGEVAKNEEYRQHRNPSMPIAAKTIANMACQSRESMHVAAATAPSSSPQVPDRGKR